MIARSSPTHLVARIPAVKLKSWGTFHAHFFIWGFDSHCAVFVTSMSWIQQHEKGVSVFCLIQARASKTQIVGLHGEPPRLKIRVSAPPVDGEANEELIAFFSKILKIPQSRIRLVSGHTGKQKKVLF